MLTVGARSFGLIFILFILIISALTYRKINSPAHSPILYTQINRTFVEPTIREQKLRCIVLVQDVKGRLGNRLFLVASGYGLARLHSCHLYLTPQIVEELKRTFLLDVSPVLISSSLFHSINNRNFTSMNSTSKEVDCRYLPELSRPNGIPPGTIFDLQGFWQSYLHFAQYADELRANVFVATQPVLQKVSTFFGDIYQKQFGDKSQFSLENHHSFKKQLAQSNRLTWIGIHIRRTDLVSKNYASSKEYIFSAIQYYTSLFSDAYFVVASDDKSYCDNLFQNQPNVSITPRSFSPGDDLITLSLCQHSIVTGGTFSWWSAYLAHGRVLHDKVCPSACEQREHYYPPWYMIDGDVRAPQS